MGVKETAAILELIKGLAQQGFGVIVISHNMEQVFDISAYICVMCQGKVAGYMKTDEVNPQDVVALITGAAELEDNINFRGKQYGHAL